MADTLQGLDGVDRPWNTGGLQEMAARMNHYAMPWTDQHSYTHLTRFPEHQLWARHVSVLEDRVDKTGGPCLVPCFWWEWTGNKQIERSFSGECSEEIKLGDVGKKNGAGYLGKPHGDDI